MKPIDCVSLFNLQQESAALIASTSWSTVVQIKKITSTTSYKSVKNMSHEASGQIESVNEPQQIEHSYDVLSIEQASLPFIKYI